MLSVEEVRARISAMHTYLTVGDMADEFGLTVHQVDHQCRKMGIKPISVRERNTAFIEENKDKMSGQRIARLLGMREDVLVNAYGRPLGIRFLDAEPIRPEVEELKISKKNIGNPSDSPRAILSRFTRGDAGHYHVGQPEPDEVMERLMSLATRAIKREDNL